MPRENFRFKDNEGIELNCYKWNTEAGITPKAIVQIAHGMAEHVLRYDELANNLSKEGYIVYGHDHRGHGLTAKTLGDIGYMDDKDNFHAMVKDLRDLNDFIKEENRDIPIILLGHSMGSFLSQRYIELYGDTINGLILMGTNGKQKSIATLGLALSWIEMKFCGRKKRSNMMDKLSFGSFNNSFKPTRTQFDWLSRDEKEVDKYIENPYCGEVFTVSYYYDLLKGLKAIHHKENLDKIPKNLEIHIFAGSKDPVGYEGQGIINLYNLYKSLNIEKVHYKLYEGGRHELLNETNKTEVIRDIKLALDEILQKEIIYSH